MHGGLLPAHAAYGLAAINAAYAEHIAKGTPLPQLLQDSEDSPLWTRIYSLPQQAADCVKLTAGAADPESQTYGGGSQRPASYQQRLRGQGVAH